MTDKSPYLKKTVTVTTLEFNPNFTDKLYTVDEPVCVCGHVYHRHFDTYDEMDACGCKYCHCHRFAQSILEWEKLNGQSYWYTPEEYLGIDPKSQGKIITDEEYRDILEDQKENPNKPGTMGYPMLNGKLCPLFMMSSFGNTEIMPFVPDQYFWCD